jgi:flavin-dependent dehydrogenase
MSSRYDVIVAGGGPAGSTAAIWCAGQGLRVALLEQRAFPRHRPGETLHPGMEGLFRLLGVGAEVAAKALTRHHGHWVRWAGGCRFAPFGGDESGPWRGYQIWRSDLDGILLERARRLGVEVLQPCRVAGAALAGRRVTGVRSDAGELRARITLDATGSRQWLARELDRSLEQLSPPLVARYGYCAGSIAAHAVAPVIELDAAGWTWTAPLAPGLFHWTTLGPGGRAWRREATEVPQAFRQLRPVGRTRGADVTWRRARRPAGPGYFLLGDAAAVLDPASSHGVLRAVMSGILAAHLVVALVGGSIPEAAARRSYRSWLRHWVEHDRRRLHELYGELRCAPGSARGIVAPLLQPFAV